MDWAQLEEGLLREVAAWLSPADARRARLVCRQWRGSLNALSTKATTPVDSGTFSRWRGCLSSLVVSLPCVKEVTIPGKVSDVGMQQLPLLAAAGQLRELRIPCAQALRDRSLLPLQQLTQLEVLRINNGQALTSRALVTLSVLAGLRTLDLRGCSKLSWLELQRSWQAAVEAYEVAQAGSSGGGTVKGGGAAQVHATWPPKRAAAQQARPPSGGGALSSRISGGGGGQLAGSGLLNNPSLGPACLHKHAMAAAAGLAAGGGSLSRHGSTAAHLAAAPPVLGNVNAAAAAPEAPPRLQPMRSCVQAALRAYMAGLELDGDQQGAAQKVPGSCVPMDWQQPPQQHASRPAMPFPRLRSLVFTCGDGFGLRGAEELAAVAGLSSLTSLELQHCQQLSDRALQQLGGLPALAALKLSGAWSLTDAGLAGLAASRLASQLTSLSLLHPVQVSGQGLQALCAFTRIASLSLVVTQDMGQEALVALVRGLPALKALDLTYPAWGDAACEALGAAAPQLASLKLHSSCAMTGAGAGALRALAGLTSLTLEACKGVEAGPLLIQGLLPPGLRAAALRGLSFGNMFAGGCVVQRPACAASLTRLTLSGCQDVGDVQLRKLVRFFPGVRELSLAGCIHLSDAGVAGALAALPALQSLDFSSTRVSGAFAESLAAAAAAPAVGSSAACEAGLLPAQAGQQLASLIMRGCSLLNDAGLRQVAGGVGHCLQTWDLADCQGVSDRGVLAVLGSMPQLSRLDVSGCKQLTREVLCVAPHYVRLVHTIGM